MATHPIRFGLQTGQQLVDWKDLKDLWRNADSWGYDSLWTFDHFYPIFVPDPAGPCLAGGSTLTALSQQPKRARIGATVNGNTYRNPCVTAKMAATLDHVSDGRLNLGLGAGWFELEHRSFGIDFKTIPGRLQALDESLQIIKGMFEQEKMTLHGRHYNVTDAVCSPKPLQKPHPPIMIGGQGQKVLLKIVAKHADMWNVPNASAERYADLLKVINRHPHTVGPHTDQIETTIMMWRTYPAPAEREKAALARVTAISGATAEQARRQIMIGSREECLATIDRYLKGGVTHFIFTLPRPFYTDEVQRFAEEVIPAVRSN